MSAQDSTEHANGNGINGNGSNGHGTNGSGNGHEPLRVPQSVEEAVEQMNQPPSVASLPFPPRGVLDDVLYDYFKRSDKMGWSVYDLIARDDGALASQPNRLNANQLSAVKTVLFVEDHLPGYLSEYLRIMTDPEVTDEQHILNRNTLHFTFRWVAEEDRHAHVLEHYLTKTGLMKQDELEEELLRERKTSYIFPYYDDGQLVEGFIYLALQEKATHLYYRALARDVDEPLLRTILTKMGADEASHGAFFYDLLIKAFKGNLDDLAKRITAVSNDFKMPVQNNLLNYRRQLLGMMRAAPSYRHTDVFTDMMRAVDRAAKTTDRETLQLITPQLGQFEKSSIERGQ